MPRKSGTQILADINSVIVDNVTGLITPAAMRTLLTNFCESVIAYGKIVARTTAGSVTATASGVAFPFTTEVGSNPYFTATLPNGVITVSDPTTPQFMRFSFVVQGTLPNNADVRFVVKKNNVDTPWETRVRSATTGDPFTADLTGAVASANNDTFQLVAYAAGNTVVTLSQVEFTCETTFTQ